MSEKTQIDPFVRLAGFTIVELVVVIVILGIIAVVVMPRLDLLSGFEERGFQDQMQSSLQYARKAAVAARRYVCVDRVGATLGFTINTAEPETLTAPISCATALPMPTSGQHGAGSSSITATGGGLGGATAVTFDALGRSIDRTTLAVAGASFTMGGAGTLSIDGETGLVH